MVSRKIVTVFLAVAVIFTACSSENEDNKTDQSLKVGGTAFRSGDLMNENVNLGEMAVIESGAPGTSERLDRAFENAPPMIPHSLEGLLPITIKNNACLTCHLPSVAEAMKSTPMPASHFTDYRPEIEIKSGKYHAYDIGEVTAKELKDKLNSARYNCSQCHVGQTNVTVKLKNLFEAEFRDSLARSVSNLSENMNEGVK